MHSVKVAILGAKGFLGRNLAHLLVGQGAEVTGWVLGDPKGEALGFECRDVTEILDGRTSHKNDFDVTINLAARRSTKASPISDEQIEEFCFEIPKNFLAATTSEKTLVINTSTYIQNFAGIEGNTVDSYGKAKEKLSVHLKEFSVKKNMKVIDLYLFTLYGIGDRPSHLVPLLLNAARSGEEISLSPGEQLMNLLHVKDAALNIIQVINSKSKDLYHKHFLWEESYFSVRDLVSQIESSVQKKINCSWGGRPYAGHEMMNAWPIPMSQLPSFETHMSLDGGIKEIWASLNPSTG